MEVQETKILCTSKKAGIIVILACIAGLLAIILSLKNCNHTLSCSVMTDDVKKASQAKKPVYKSKNIKTVEGEKSIVETRTGKEYVGFFRQKNNSMEITTEDGIVIVPLDEVKMIKPKNF